MAATRPAAPLSSSSHKFFLDQIKTGFSNTYLKVQNFVKTYFFQIIAFALLVGSYFAIGFNASLIAAGGITVVFAAQKILNRLKTSRFTTPSDAPSSSLSTTSSSSTTTTRREMLRKISSAPLDVEKQTSFVLSSGRVLHDSVQWLRDYTSSSKTFAEKKKMRRDIGFKTMETVRKHGVQGSFQISDAEIDQMRRNTAIVGQDVTTAAHEQQFFQTASTNSTLPTLARPQPVEIIEGDSFDVALTLKREKGYRNVAVLNMANATSPGGGFLTGCAAQEEALCRRSTLFDSINIHPVRPDRGNYNTHLSAKMGGTYQVPEFGALFSPRVKVFRSNLDEGFAYYKQPKEVNVISSAAYDVVHSARPADYREKTKRKLQMILNTALERKQEAVVLGAYGCGAFGNDPKEVAAIVKEILKARPIYQQRMKIVFAIITDSNDRSGNLKSFSDALHNFVR